MTPSDPNSRGRIDPRPRGKTSLSSSKLPHDPSLFPPLSPCPNNGGRRARKISTGYRINHPPPLAVEGSFFPFSFFFLFEKGRFPRLLDERAFTRRGSMTNYELAVNERNSLATFFHHDHESAAIVHVTSLFL